MVQQVESAGREEQLALLRAHPDLGTRARLSAASGGEQAGAGLDTLTAGEYDWLLRLNAQYRETFGFPFLFAVKGSNKYDILNALEERVRSAPEIEFQVALDQVYRIASFRLKDLLS
jgi:2-oxo-4-hydroxy-4-carboxy-5-ureidoimidazoline decarboxylase